MSDPIQWLLIGGEHNGKTMWIKQGGRVSCGGVIYNGQNYLSNGRLYRIGFVDPNDLLPSKVDAMIRAADLTHIAGS